MSDEMEATGSDAFIQRINEKSWFADDDTLTLHERDTHVGDGLYSWTTETYIAIYQIKEALDDPDVIMGDLNPGRRPPLQTLPVQRRRIDHD